ncbi:MAG TPA: ASCH domain-containing protein [Candidatus Acidoferrum sp.]|nr:ASCH domain-containing protein [Candidatus Acidoferrum sp.]
MRTFNLNIRGEYLKLILDGRKTIEVRVAYPRFAGMAAGDTIRFNGEHEYRVTRVARYPDFEALVRAEDPRRMHPTDPDNLLAVLREIYLPEKEALGVLAIHLGPADAHG